MAKHSRKKLLINPPFQIRMIVFSMSIAFVVVGIYGFVGYRFVLQLNEIAEKIGNNEFTQFLVIQKRSFYALFYFVSFVLFAFLTAAGMVISHRIAGPLYRLRKHLLELAEGKTKSTVKFRDHDYFPELADACNRVVKYLFT